MKNYTRYVIFLLIVVCCTPSCVTHRDLLMTKEGEERDFESIQDYTIIREDRMKEFKSYRIQPYDQLIIRVNAFDGSTEGFLNREFAPENGYSSNIDYTPESIYFSSYNVRETGDIILPILDRLYIEGMTVNELKSKLDELYSPYLKYPSTTVRLANMRITLLGEINTPGVHYLYNEKNTILDAISIAGDFTDFANLTNVKLIRQTKIGSETVYLNLSKPDFVYTEYFYVRPHDVIYIEPLKEKMIQVNAQTVGVILSAASLLILVLNTISSTN